MIRIPVHLSGRFVRVSDLLDLKGRCVIGMIGSLNRETITDEDIAFIKMFYCRTGWKHWFSEKFPDGFNPRAKMALGNFNGFIVLEE